MEQQPHVETPRFIDKDEREHVEFYQGWIRTALIEGLAGVDDLILLRDRFSLDPSDEQQLYQLDFDLEPFQAVAKQIRDKIDEEVHYSAQDLRNNIFKAELFKVGIVVDKDIWVVEDIATRGERILPVINGEPYEGGIDDVLFDR